MPLLSLPLSMALAAGFCRGVLDFFRTPLNAAVFSAAMVLLYFLAILLLYIDLPIYSTAKSFYALGAIPCLAVLGSLGLAGIMKNRVGRALVFSLLTTWSVFGLVGYIA